MHFPLVFVVENFKLCPGRKERFFFSCFLSIATELATNTYIQTNKHTHTRHHKIPRYNLELSREIRKNPFFAIFLCAHISYHKKIHSDRHTNKHDLVFAVRVHKTEEIKKCLPNEAFLLIAEEINEKEKERSFIYK